MLNPILVTLPRTGSTIICQMLGDICRHSFDYKNDLQEFFTVEPQYKNVYEGAFVFGEKIITIKTNKQVHPVPLWYGSNDNIPHIIALRAEMLSRNNHRYMIKLFASQLYIKHIRESVFPRYQPLYLQRKNLFKQFLSSIYLGNDTLFHYNASQTAKVKPLKFSYTRFISFKKMVNDFKSCLSLFPGPTVVYEDIIGHNDPYKALADVLGVSCEGMVKTAVKTIPTPYPIPLEEMIIQDDVWFRHKSEIEDYFQTTI